MQVKTSIAVTRRTTCTVSNRTYYWINDDDDSQNKAVFCSLNVTLPKVNISGPLVCNVTVNATNALGNVTKLFRDEYPASSGKELVFYCEQTFTIYILAKVLLKTQNQHS